MEGVGGGGIFVPVLTLVVIFIFVIMRLVLLAIFGLEYLDNFIQALGISWNFLNEVIHANHSTPRGIVDVFFFVGWITSVRK